jgi:hypothetical protein
LHRVSIGLIPAIRLFATWANFGKFLLVSTDMGPVGLFYHDAVERFIYDFIADWDELAKKRWTNRGALSGARASKAPVGTGHSKFQTSHQYRGRQLRRPERAPARWWMEWKRRGPAAPLEGRRGNNVRQALLAQIEMLRLSEIQSRPLGVKPGQYALREPMHCWRPPLSSMAIRA